MATFKTEKQFQDWLAANPRAAERVRRDGPSPTMSPAPIALAISGGVQVTARLPAARPAPPRVPLRLRLERVAAWLFVGVVALSSLGIVATVSALLALEYLR